VANRKIDTRIAVPLAGLAACAVAVLGTLTWNQVKVGAIQKRCGATPSLPGRPPWVTSSWASLWRTRVI
jgi:hypothetical protein